LKCFKGFELKMKKIINAASEILAACGGHLWHDDTFLVYKYFNKKK
jgi:hypothetical protein